MIINKHKIDISHPDKLLFKKERIKKIEIIEYYKKIGKFMLPYTKNRPISMERFPQGINKQGFYQKEIPDYFPKFIKVASVDIREGTKQKQVMINNLQTLVYLANQDCISSHIWLSKQDKINYPDKIVYDLDPPKNNSASFEKIKFAAFKLKEKLEKIKLKPYLMLTGSSGLHLVVPIKREYNFNQVRKIAKKIATELVQENKSILTLEIRKDKRNNRIFIDYLRNAFGQTVISPYSLRAKEKASIATPIEWSELKKSDISSDKYNIDNIFKRLAKKKDPWSNMNKNKKSIRRFL